MRAIRGATQLSQDDHVEMAEATGELVLEMLSRNGLSQDEVVSVLFTATPDLHSDFPAAGARLKGGFEDVPLMCFSEMSVPGALERVVRVMMHVDTQKPRSEIKHVYLRGTDVLRRDLHEDD